MQEEYVQVLQPIMNGVDRSDQMLSSHNVSLNCYRWWKTLFFHLVDIAVVNGFLLFQKHREANPEDEALRSPNNYSVVEFREAMIRQICSWPEYDYPPAYVKSAPGHSQFQTDHMLVASEEGDRRNCFVCYKEAGGEKKVSTYCTAPQCQKFLHTTQNFNCFRTFHFPGYDRS